MADIPLIKKHQPKKISEIVGQKQAVDEVLRFVKNFPNTRKKALLLWGPSGVGKTAIAQALAQGYNFELVEMNASNFRDKESVQAILGSASKQASIFGHKKIILIDEAEGISGQEDRGGAKAVAEIIEETKFPIILTANDAYSEKLKSVRKNCLLLEMKGITQLSILTKLKEICKKEKIEFEEGALQKIALHADGDLRAAINDLQIFSEGNQKITEKEIEFWGRDKEESIFNVLKIIFKSFDAEKANEFAENMEDELEDLMLWLDQNIPIEYYRSSDVAEAFDCVSFADIFLSRIRRWQHWRFLVYASNLLSSGVQQAKSEASPKFVSYQRPEILLKIFIRAAKRKKIESITKIIGPLLHSSSYELARSFFPYYVFIQEHNKEMAERMNEWLRLGAE